MNWHNGNRWKAFQRRQARLAEEYRRQGMSEEQIRELYRFDLEVFRSDRRFYRHVWTLEAESGNESWEESLTRQFPEAVTVPPEAPLQEETDWLADIDSPELSLWLQSLPKKSLELLTLLAFRGYTQVEVAQLWGCTAQNVNQALRHLRAQWPRGGEEDPNT